ncbi:hypothetical protein GON03_17775 [Nocardioides sp. MAH-18]|uniref:Peptidase M15C domain-containing protein n=1 Tax=Nocardioides agri TaxID=2682843 RepID=A0A6L6XX50_9ACTN|nr:MULTISPECIES: M15 family metallopeptidase [unclassified Nocardioides]MBA2956192.1 M15 family metallopeptidase [Nocardioides sp. CGMCC 1.13656]MVQ51036.1 hypothetical protein [Nocardioides sp. MAH-18]
MKLGLRTVAAGCLLALVVGLAPAGAAAGGTTITLTAAPAHADDTTQVVVTVTDAGGAAVAGAAVAVERRTGGVWQPAGTVATGADGRAAFAQVVARSPDDNAVRATYDGAVAETLLPLRRRAAQVSLDGPRAVVGGQPVSLALRWTSDHGAPVAGTVTVWRLVPGGRWRRAAQARTDADGRATQTVSPRTDTRWRVTTPRLPWLEKARSAVLRLDDRPPGTPVRLPAAAPGPRISLPPQGPATGEGPDLWIGAVSDRVWSQMTGVTWHSGCPVGRSGLRLVRVNYWDYDGYPRRGELVANADAAYAMGAALAEMYRRRLPIRAMHRVDRFGWSARVRGGDDYASMASGNTSAFNCRDVVGRPGRRSPHAWGRALDVNTWENPYRSARGIVPNTWWQGHSHPLVAWRSRSHAVVELMARHGLRWTYGNGDTQHFDYVGVGKRALARHSGPPPCRRFCD